MTGDALVGTEVCRITVDGDPTTKARPRVLRNGHTYTPRKTRDAEERVRWLLVASRVTPDADHLLGVTLRFRTATRHRRDLDNLVKLVLDACNGQAWRDDYQVTRLDAEVVRRSNNPGFDLVVTRLERCP